jgi:hypothetical protein
MILAILQPFERPDRPLVAGTRRQDRASYAFMGLSAMKPAPGEGRGVAGGIVLSVLLHPIALIAVGLIGLAIDRREGALLIVPFLALIGVAQWLYLGPTAWLLRRRGATAVAKGVVIAGGLLMLGSTLCYGGMGLLSLQNAAEVRRIRQTEAAHPTEFVSTDGVVTAVDDAHFEFRREDGTVVSLQTWKGLDYIFLKKNGGYEQRTRDILKPGVRVSVDYSHERGRPPVSASIVRVYEEGARR